MCGCLAEEKADADTVITINGENVSKTEYLIYLRETAQNFELIGGEDIWDTDFDGKDAWEVAKESAFNSVVAVKLAAARASDYSVKFNENDEIRAEMEALKMAESMGEEKDSPYYECALRVVKDKNTYTLVKENVVKDIKISDAQINAYCEENRQLYRENLKNTECDIFYFDEYDDAKAFMAEGGSENEYKEEYSGEAGELKERFGIEKAIAENAVLGPFETEDGYAVVKIKKCTAAEEDFVEESMINDYESSVKSEFFAKEADKWLQAANIEINDELWQSIEFEDVR